MSVVDVIMHTWWWLWAIYQIDYAHATFENETNSYLVLIMHHYATIRFSTMSDDGLSPDQFPRLRPAGLGETGRWSAHSEQMWLWPANDVCDQRSIAQPSAVCCRQAGSRQWAGVVSPDPLWGLPECGSVEFTSSALPRICLLPSRLSFAFWRHWRITFVFLGGSYCYYLQTYRLTLGFKRKKLYCSCII